MRTGPFPTLRVADVKPPSSDGQWLVHSLLATSSVAVVGGPPKASKTWVALDLAVSIASATPCLGVFEVERPGAVLAYLAEDSLEMARKRIEGICASRRLGLDSLDLHLITEPTLRLDLDSDLDRLQLTVSGLKPSLLLLDPFVRMHRAHENDAGEISQILAGLRALQRNHDVAITLVHHSRKNDRGQAGLSLRGSGDIYAWLDSFLSLERRDAGYLLRVEHRFERSPEPVALKLMSEPGGAPHLEVDRDPRVPADNSARPALAEAIFRELAAVAGPLTRTAIRDRLKVNNERLGAALAELTAAGRIHRTDHGWAVPAPPAADRSAVLALGDPPERNDLSQPASRRSLEDTCPTNPQS